MCANSEGSGETARMSSLAWAFAVRLGDKYHNFMSWLSFIGHKGLLMFLYAGCHLKTWYDWKLDEWITSFQLFPGCASTFRWLVTASTLLSYIDKGVISISLFLIPIPIFVKVHLNDHWCMGFIYTQFINLNGSCVWKIYENKSGLGIKLNPWLIGISRNHVKIKNEFL